MNELTVCSIYFSGVFSYRTCEPSLRDHLGSCGESIYVVIKMAQVDEISLVGFGQRP